VSAPETVGLLPCVLLGNNEEILTHLLKALIGHSSPVGEQVRWRRTRTAGGLRRQARRGGVDLAIVILNNLMASADQRGDRIEQALEAIRYDKARVNTPLIVYSGYCPDLAFANRVRQAGADYFSTLPFSPRRLLQVLRKHSPQLFVGPVNR
jgi:CheY-like chemotaxis protein